jgi:predicted ester cyclase
MKIFFILLVLMFFSCKPSSNDASQQVLLENTHQADVEMQTRSLLVAYLKDLEAKDWRKNLKNYGSGSQESHEDFLVEHEKFRSAFQNYKVKIKHIAIDGNDAIAWLTVSAVHAGQYDVEELKGTPATGKNVEWDEVWYIDVVDGKFGNKWDFIANGVTRMKQLGIKCLPEDF